MAKLSLAIDSTGARLGANQFKQATDKVKRDAAGAKRSVRGVGTQMKTLGATAASTRRLIGGLFAGFGAIYAVRAAIGIMASFEETMARVKNTSQATAEEFKKLQKTARTLGATTRFSATEAAEGLRFLAQAGFDVEKSIAALPHTLNLATSQQIGLGESADWVSNIMSQFGLSAAETERVVDTLTTTANSANTDIRQLSEAMKYAGTLSGDLGISVEEAAAALGVMGDAGTQGTMAGTALTATLAALMKPTDAAKAALSEMGLTIDDVSLRTNTLTEAMETLGRAGMDPTQAMTIFGKRAIRGVLPMVKFIEKMKEMTKASEEAKGATKKAAEVLEDTLGGAYKSLISTLQEMTLQTGDTGFLGTLKNVIFTVTDAIRVIIGLEEHVKNATPMVYFLADAFRFLGYAVGVFIAYKIGSMFVSMVMGIRAAIGAMKTLTISLMTNPFGLIAVALAAIVALLYIYKDELIVVEGKTMTVADAMGGAWDHLRDNVAAFIEMMKDEGPKIGDGFVRGWNKSIRDLERGTTNAKFLWGLLRDTVMGKGQPPMLLVGLSQIKEVLNRNIALIKGMIELMIELQKISAKVTKAAIGTSLLGSLIVPDAFDDVSTTALEKRFSKIIKDMTGEQKDYVGDFFKGAGETAEKHGALAGGIFGKAFKGILGKIDLIGIIPRTGFGGWLSTLLDPTLARESIARRGQARYERRQRREEPEEPGDGGETPEDKVKNLVDKIKELMAAADEAAGPVEEVTNQFEGMAESLSSTLTGALSAIITGSDSAAGALKRLLISLMNIGMEQFITKPLEGFMSGLFGGIIGGGAGAATASAATPRLGGTFAFAHGGAFSGGNIIPFANGGVVGSPSYFGMSGGRTGLMGEAGPEAAMPLVRTSSGELGVRAEGGRRIVNVTMNIYTQDANSFRKSKGQIAREMQNITMSRDVG